MKNSLEFLKSIEFQPAIFRKSIILNSIREIDTQNRLSVNIQKFLFKKEDCSNIIVAATGKLLKKIVVGAHYDIWPKSGGANDNGAAVFILLELIKLVLTIPNLENSVDFCFFDLEEKKQRGAKEYLKLEQQSEILCMINLDMCGIGDYIIFNETLSDFPHLSSMLEDICTVNKLHHRMLLNLPPGDEIPFQNADIPAISIGIVPEVTIPIVEQLALMTSTKGITWKKIKKSVKFMLNMIKGYPVLQTMHSKDDTVETVSVDSIQKVYRAISILFTEIVEGENN